MVDGVNLDRYGYTLTLRNNTTKPANLFAILEFYAIDNATVASDIAYITVGPKTQVRYVSDEIPSLGAGGRVAAASVEVHQRDANGTRLIYSSKRPIEK